MAPISAIYEVVRTAAPCLRCIFTLTGSLYPSLFLHCPLRNNREVHSEKRVRGTQTQRVRDRAGQTRSCTHDWPAAQRAHGLPARGGGAARAEDGGGLNIVRRPIGEAHLGAEERHHLAGRFR